MNRIYRMVMVGVMVVLGVGAAWAEESAYVPTVMIVENDLAVQNLVDRGAVIWNRRGDMVIALLPRSVNSARQVPGVKRMERGKRAVPAMDIARQQYDAWKLASGEGLPHTYTGKGVVVGLCDIGIDPNHIAFRDADGNSRVKRVAHLDELQGTRTILTTPEEIAAWTSDNDDQFHGTHVANIMAGSYKGEGLQGMAPDAEIVATSCNFYDAGILSACEEIVAYAKSVGKPAVINLSLSSYTGPKDGTSLFCRYMDLLAEDAIVVMAAGNTGNINGSKHLTFTESAPVWRTYYKSSDWIQFHVAGVTEVWSYDTRPVGVKLLIMDEDTRKPVYEGTTYYNDRSFSFTISDENDEEFAKYLTGTVQVEAEVYSLNGRWLTQIGYDTTCATGQTNNPQWARYVIGFEFNAAPGVVADVTADSVYSFFNAWPGYSSADNSQSISDICTGDNVISVGMYSTRNTAPTLGGTDMIKSYDLGVVYRASSYGTIKDGRVFPHTVAPGAGIVSAVNGYYIEKNPDLRDHCCYESVVDGKSYYWTFMLGTSMASPYVAGTIAAWLEANPKMTVQDVQKILESTNLRDCPTPEDPRNGQGWLQPYEGMKMAIQETGLTPGVTDSARPVIVVRGDMLELLNPGANRLAVTVTAIDGTMPLSEVEVADAVSQISISSLPKGVYVARVAGESGIAESVKFIR